jgi:prepilin-type processing-associated H-X9-DG protein
VQKVRLAANQTVCTNNLKQIGLAAHNYASSNSGSFPPYYAASPVGSQTPPETQVFVALLPYMEQSAVYQSFGTPLNLQTAGTGIGHRAVLKNFQCPIDPTYSTGLVQGDWASGCYVCNFQVFGNPIAGNSAPGNGAGTPNLGSTFVDGTSNTVIFAERSAQTSGHWTLWAHGDWNNSWGPTFAYGSANGATNYNSGMDSWTQGYVGTGAMFLVQPSGSNNPPPPGLASSWHPSGMNTCFGDGSVHLLSANLNPTFWWDVCTPAGNETGFTF